MNESIGVSIIVTAYNVEKYIERSLNALIEQTFSNVEIIVVNDGSTDETQQIIDKFSLNHPKRIQSIIMSKNSGPSAARNYALQYATGEYIAFVDADDVALPQMYEKMYSLAKQQNSDFVQCGRIYCDEAGNIDSTFLPMKIPEYTNIFESPTLLSNTSSFLWDKIFKASVIKKYNFRFDDDIHYAEDALFVYIFLYYSERVSTVYEALYRYTIHRKGSITGAMDFRMLHEIKSCERITKFYVDIGYFDTFYKQLLWICVGFWGRKFYSFHKTPGHKHEKYLFVKEMYQFLSRYYWNWKWAIRKYATADCKWKYKINYYKTRACLKNRTCTIDNAKVN